MSNIEDKIKRGREIAERATKGPWELWTNHPTWSQPVITGDEGIVAWFNGMSPDDRAFLATACNEYAQLLRVAEAADRLINDNATPKDYSEHPPMCAICGSQEGHHESCDWLRLQEALEAYSGNEEGQQ